MADAPPPIRPREETLRRIDWLAVAPWLLVLRAVGATIGWPMVVGAVGMIALEWGSPDLPDARFRPWQTAQLWVAQWPLSFQWWSRNVFSTSAVYLLVWPIVRYLGWLFLGMVIAECAVRRLVDSDPVGLRQALRRSLRRSPRLLGAVGLLAAPALMFALALGLTGWLAKSDSLDLAAAVGFGGAAACFGLPLAILFAVGVLASPLLVASVVIDDSDPFNALSRAFAYTLQKPGSLAACVAIGWLGAIVGGAVVEWLTRTALELTGSLGGFPRPQFEHSIAEASAATFARAARGFYPAYFFAAGVATYLVMRHQVDGQPLDEITQPTDESPSPDA